ncbi:MAG: hypothetical protein OXR05_05585 [Gemmatimonadota bacterium]|nr:hypothetical protein [Gemmatimonadota bacterium]
MPGTRFPIPGALAVLCGLVASQPVAAQVPLGIRTASGLTISPVYEGWYENPDGTFSLSFGYYNRNFEEIVELPHDAANQLEPAAFDGAQPTRFHPRRHWGVFTVTVPADFGDQAVVWTIDFRGERTSIPGRLHLDWRIDALDGEAETGNTPPMLAFAEDGPRGAGPGGPWGEPVEGVVGTSLPLTVWAWDDGRSRGSVVRAGRTGVPVTLTWFKHLGPGDVTFAANTATVPIEGGKATTVATFTEPGDYVIRVRANDGSGVSTAGHSQCCWTNGFVRVRVTR